MPEMNKSVLTNLRARYAELSKQKALRDEVLRWINALPEEQKCIVVKELITLLDSQDTYTRRFSTQLLGELKESTAAARIAARLMEDNDTSVRRLAADALAKISGTEARDVLILAAKSYDAVVRQYAVNALGSLEYEDVAPLIINATKDENYHVRISAINALCRVNSAEQVTQILLDALNDTNQHVRARAIYHLGVIEDKSLIPIFIKGLKDDYGRVREWAADALREIPSDAAVQPLINALNDNDERVRAAVVRALGAIKSSDAVHPLMQALEDQDLQVRMRAAQSLGQIGDPAARFKLEKLSLHGSTVGEKKLASEALSKLSNL
jgi:HEAT repeat protein